jgi:hypothetical protein
MVSQDRPIGLLNERNMRRSDTLNEQLQTALNSGSSSSRPNARPVAGVDAGIRECDGRVVVALRLAGAFAEWSTLGCTAGISGAGFRVGLACGDQQPGRTPA